MPHRTASGHSRERVPIQTERLVIIQVIASIWSKEFRGGANAALRNRVSEAETVPQPDTPVIGPAVLIHRSYHSFGSASVSELYRRGGKPGTSVSPLDSVEDVRVAGISLRSTGNELSVDYTWLWDAGMPRRRSCQDILKLTEGTWGQIRFNERHSPYHTVNGWDGPEWWYEKWVVNAGVFSTFEPRAFVDTQPCRTISMMGQLR